MAKHTKAPYRLYLRGKTWHAYFSFKTENGERIQFRETTSTDDFEQAQSYCLKRISKLQQKASIKEGHLVRITLDEVFGQYFMEKAQFQSRADLIFSRLEYLKRDLGITFLDEINEPLVQSFVARHRRIPGKDYNQKSYQKSNATINRYLSLLSAIIRTYKKMYLTSDIKPLDFRLEEEDENIAYLKDWQLAKKIIDKAAPHLKPIIYTALYTGLRENNILNLKWENLDLINDMLTVRIKNKKKQGGKNHTLPIIPKLKEIFMEQPKINEFVFNYKGNPIKSIYNAWRSIFFKRVYDKNSQTCIFPKGGNKKIPLKDPEIPYIRFHDLRHTCATWILKSTGDQRIIQRILGHSDIRTTSKYAHIMKGAELRALESVYKND